MTSYRNVFQNRVCWPCTGHWADLRHAHRAECLREIPSGQRLLQQLQRDHRTRYPLDDCAGAAEIQPSSYGEKQRADCEHGSPFRHQGHPVCTRGRTRPRLHHRHDEDF